jgi:hypothetical protein
MWWKVATHPTAKFWSENGELVTLFDITLLLMKMFEKRVLNRKGIK